MKDTLLAYIRARHFSAVARTYFDLLLVDGTEQAKLFIRTLFIYNPPSQKKQKNRWQPCLVDQAFTQGKR